MHCWRLRTAWQRCGTSSEHAQGVAFRFAFAMSAYMFLNTILPVAIAGTARMAKLGYSLPVQSSSNVVFQAELAEHCVLLNR
jgi:hypothetical protein